jgi:hypothetical protein
MHQFAILPARAGTPATLRYSRSMRRYDAIEVPEFSTTLDAWIPLARTAASPGFDTQPYEGPLPASMKGFTRLGVDLTLPEKWRASRGQQHLPRSSWIGKAG